MNFSAIVPTALAVMVTCHPQSAVGQGAPNPAPPEIEKSNEGASPLQPVLDAYKAIKTYQGQSTFWINARGQEELGTLMLNGWSTRYDRERGYADVNGPGAFRFVQGAEGLFVTLPSVPEHYLQGPRFEPLTYSPIRGLLHRVQKGGEIEIPLVAVDLMLMTDGRCDALVSKGEVSALAGGSDEEAMLREALTSAQSEGATVELEGPFESYRVKSADGALCLLINAKTHLIAAATLDVDSSWLDLPAGIPLRLYQVCSDVVVNEPLDAAEFALVTEGLIKVESEAEYVKLVPKMEQGGDE